MIVFYYDDTLSPEGAATHRSRVADCLATATFSLQSNQRWRSKTQYVSIRAFKTAVGVIDQ